MNINNKQNDLQGFGTPAQLFYLEIEANPTEVPVENIPLNVLVNAPNEHFLLPAVHGKNEHDQVCVYVDSGLDGGSKLLCHINSDKSYPVNDNRYYLQNHYMNIEPSDSRQATSNNSSVILSNCNEQVTANVNIQTCTTELKMVTNENRSTEKTQIKGFVRILDRVVPARAFAVLPSALHFRRECISPRRSLPQRVRFGPVQGVNHTISASAARDMVQNAAKSKEPVFLLHNKHSVIYIDVSDKDKSNWLGLLPLGNQSTANVWLYEEDNLLFGITVHAISPGTPLTLGYSKPYMKEHGIPQGQPVLDISEDLMEEPRQWRCNECQRVFATPHFRRRHIEQCHTDDITVVRRRYRCRHCTRTFTRLCTLKRHMVRYCNKKSKKVNSNKTTPSEDTLNTSLNIDRLPSDESLQNYTNGLDFSSSLFDTDRIPGLDISGSSRSETEFNSYGIPFRDENALTADLGFDKLSNVLTKSHNGSSEPTREQTQSSESMLISCPHCKLTILREKKREHLSECPEKRLACECGRTFTNTDKLAQHVHDEHSVKIPSKTEPVQSNALEYKCEKCQILFKRRGMLVNHLWRVHRSRTPVPLERRVRHYPCVACPKLYRTAAKRDTHQAVHHPDVSTSGRYSIEGGRRSVAPSACSVCPRQYATRAKLLQHVRQSHPEQALPVKQPSKAKSTSQNIHTKLAVG